MNLTPEQKKLIQRSYERIIEHDVNLATHFYDCLFEMAPLIRPMFKSERPIFEYHFNEIITTAVYKIHHFDEFTVTLTALGRQHRGFGTQVSQFEVVKSALLLSIQECLRGQSNPQIEQAWAAYYDEIAKVMIKGMLAADGQE